VCVVQVRCIYHASENKNTNALFGKPHRKTHLGCLRYRGRCNIKASIADRVVTELAEDRLFWL
jgi:hypothetical protein